MKEQLKVNQIVYNILKTQIKFGTYGYGEHLPPIEEMAELLVVSTDTVRLAYRQLQKEGYVTLSKSIGSIVTIHYDDEEIEQNIQTFFSGRKDMLLDVCCSIPLLFGNIQLHAWKKVPLEDLCKLKDKFLHKRVSPSYLAILYVQMVYRSLKNDIVIRLIRSVTIAYMGPLLSLKEGEANVRNSIPHKITLCCQRDWAALKSFADEEIKKDLVYLNHFYETRITVPAAQEQHVFIWSSYKKASQICYSVGFDILSSIVLGHYPVGSFLPSLKSLAKEKQVSISTIRHTLALLNDLGIAKTINGIGTQILSMDQIGENCNLSSLIVQRRLLDCKQSLQFFALSCRDIAAFTISSIDAESKAQWIEQFYLFERLEKFDLVFPFSLQYISQVTPYQTIRTVYTELYELLLWGIPLRGMMGTQETVNDFYRPYHQIMIDYLKNSDAEGFAATLEEILNHEVEVITKRLMELGIKEVESKPVSKYRDIRNY